VPDYELLRELIRYLIIAFATLTGAGIGLPPIPEEMAVIAWGMWTGLNPAYGPLRWLMLPAVILGAIAADVLLYSIGRLFGARLLQHRLFARLAPPDKRARIQENFHRYGVSILIVGRLFPGIRTGLFMTAGMMHLPIVRFVLADLLGAVLGNSILFVLAFWLGDRFKEFVLRVKHDLSVVGPLLIMIAIIAALTYLLLNFLRRPISTGDPKEVPLIGEQVAAHMPHKDEAVSAAPPVPVERPAAEPEHPTGSEQARG
jgi:membrane protein DedA with SNARE-associated domain